MASRNAGFAARLAIAAAVLLTASATSAQVPPAGAPAAGPPPGFGGTLVPDPAFNQGGSGGGGGGGGNGQPAPQPQDKLRLTKAGIKRSAREIAAQIECQVSGNLTIRTWSGGFLGAKGFSCAGATLIVRVKLTRKRFRTLRRKQWKVKLILTGAGERHVYKGNFRVPMARAAAGRYWTGAEGYCGLYLDNNPYGAGTFKYRLNAPPISNSTPGAGPDVAQVRYYWFRFGVGWVGDSGWTPPFNIPDETGAIFIGVGWEYTLIPDAHAWYAGAIAIAWRNSGVVDWNWVSTFPQNASNPVIGNTWCGTDP